MPHWEYRVNVADVWRNPEMTFEQRRDSIVATLRRNRWFKIEGDEGSELHEVVEGLSHADDATDFDHFWDQLYDLADLDRAWIATF
ncbi:hypothetical protein AB0H43_03190 [Hamadaea sp. NPDC050747]|uniref:hypothetical protein n=1 Tax=Hamadaea sp. NPDC050747 TaxID=3155789 RepID=UPI0033D48B2F